MYRVKKGGCERDGTERMVREAKEQGIERCSDRRREGKGGVMPIGLGAKQKGVKERGKVRGWGGVSTYPLPSDLIY